MDERVEIITGEVTDVQNTSHSVVAESGLPRRRSDLRMVSRGSIRTRTRLLVRDEAGKEQTFDFEGATIGVRDGHRVAIARGRRPGGKAPVNLMLVNVSTDHREVFEAALAAHLRRYRLIGPLAMAAALSVLTLIIAIALHQWVLPGGRDATLSQSFWWAMFPAILFSPLYWWGARAWRRFSDYARFRAGRDALVAEIEGRLRAHLDPDPPSAT